MMDIQFSSTVLFVKDIEASRKFYEGLLGQKVLIDHGVTLGFEKGFSLWHTEHAFPILFDASSGQEDKLGSECFELYFETEDLEAAWDKISVAGVEIMHPMSEQPWGQRVFRIFDPDGNIIEIGEPLPQVVIRLLSQGMIEEEIAEHLEISLEAVHKIARIK
jgi:predicted enzyme related to lactoylglutathione lyase